MKVNFDKLMKAYDVNDPMSAEFSLLNVEGFYDFVNGFYAIRNFIWSD